MKKLLAQSAFWILNKNVAKALKSNDAALLLAELLDLHVQHPDEDMVFCQQERLMENCNLTITGLRNAMKLLFDAGVVYIEKRGVPAKNYYKVLDEKVNELLSSGTLSTSDQPTNDNKSEESISSSDTESYSTSEQESLEQINNQINIPIEKESIEKESSEEVCIKEEEYTRHTFSQVTPMKIFNQKNTNVVSQFKDMFDEEVKELDLDNLSDEDLLVTPESELTPELIGRKAQLKFA